MANIGFDKKGFFFALKFLLILTLIFSSAKFLPYFIFSVRVSGYQNQSAQADFVLSQHKKEKTIQSSAAAVSLASKENRDIKLGFVGDVMLDRGVESAIKNYGRGDYRFPFLRMADKLQEYDFLFGNLEGPVSDKGENLGSAYSFRMEPKAIEGLKFAGFDVLSVANNHIGDWGEEAMKDTFSHLKETGILYVGGGFDKKEEANELRSVEIKGTKIAFLGFSQFGKNYDEIEKRVKEAKEKSDVVVVSFHWGEEYQKEPNDYQKRIGHLAIEAGADLVIGHHPHVVQPVEKYQDSYIAYSLGNFVFDQNFSEETMKGLLLETKIKDKKISEVNPVEIKISENFQPFIP